MTVEAENVYKPRTAGDQQEPGGGAGRILPGALRRNRPCQNLDARLLASRTEREHISAILSRSASGHLFQPPQEANPL